MFVDLIDFMRCPHTHEESWLVLATRRVVGRDVIDGTLGCPVCRAEYAIVDGVARLDGGNPRRTRGGAADESEALRLAALLDLTDPKGYAILVGEMANHAPALRALTGVQFLLVDPPPAIAMGDGLSGLTIDTGSTALPLAAGTARAIAFDEALTAEQVTGWLSTVNTGGRVVAPVAVPLPPGVKELAHDDRHWVAEREHALLSSGIVSIDRRK